MSRLLLISFLSFNFSVSVETNQWVEYFKYEGEGGDTRIAEYNTRINFLTKTLGTFGIGGNFLIRSILKLSPSTL